MKRRLFLLAAALLTAFAFAGCDKGPETPAVNLSTRIVGEWHCITEQYDVDVYVAFYADGKFDEYQRIGEGRHRHYDGEWFLDKEILSGVYSDGQSWGSSYVVSFDGETMTLTSTNELPETMTYVKEEIPAEVKDSAIAPFSTRLEESKRWF